MKTQRALYNELTDLLSLKQYSQLMGGSMTYANKAQRAKSLSKSKKVHALANEIIELSNLIDVVEVTSDNYEKVLFTMGAYEELVLQMSTGDFSVHKHKIVRVKDYTNVVGLVEVTDGNGNVIGHDFEEMV